MSFEWPILAPKRRKTAMVHRAANCGRQCDRLRQACRSQIAAEQRQSEAGSTHPPGEESQRWRRGFVAIRPEIARPTSGRLCQGTMSPDRESRSSRDSLSRARFASTQALGSSSALRPGKRRGRRCEEPRDAAFRPARYSPFLAPHGVGRGGYRAQAVGGGDALSRAWRPARFRALGERHSTSPSRSREVAWQTVATSAISIKCHVCGSTCPKRVAASNDRQARSMRPWRSR